MPPPTPAASSTGDAADDRPRHAIGNVAWLAHFMLDA